ncbi:prolipoprotein diacylglyceryl transferase [Aestuariirhabdus litorea]|uniref:Phosphatidylglycerol--prolipoprotein diacylglyceryl transferase n=1 Tax=Aestuariirhabdus litorea TaxID=2528527 RepID=A0A3P3VK39_9GAMM|nr:prolipoprotein diacylglyceryl transferase [Aestuariirhabdus litorea]RRJ83092.1 prolipoprotein diacylglyceryl transferase [Aestuariirhabdus litorea]RWW93249.1 prolipoprotein diacylglyceryl transferase [Endozoicomonadaceae bacterium GTF-13]
MIPYPHIDPVAVAIGPFKVHWYGLMYLVGFVGGWWLGQWRARRSGGLWQAEQVGDLVFYIAMGVILGGRCGYVLFYNFDYFLQDPLWLFAIWEGGMSFHGGLLGVLIAMLLYGRRVGKSFFQLTDFIAPLVPIGLGAGRIGNFIGGELWGRAAEVPWAMVFPRDPLQLARHPSQLYQFALEGVVLFLVLWWFSSRPRPRMAVSGLFLVCYGSFRILVEFFREPDTQLGFIAFDWMTMGQLLSLPMVLVGAALMLWGYRRYPLEAGINRDDALWLEQQVAREPGRSTSTQRKRKGKR